MNMTSKGTDSLGDGKPSSDDSAHHLYALEYRGPGMSKWTVDTARIGTDREWVERAAIWMRSCHRTYNVPGFEFRVAVFERVQEILA